MLCSRYYFISTVGNNIMLTWAASWSSDRIIYETSSFVTPHPWLLPVAFLRSLQPVCVCVPHEESRRPDTTWTNSREDWQSRGQRWAVRCVSSWVDRPVPWLHDRAAGQPQTRQHLPPPRRTPGWSQEPDPWPPFCCSSTILEGKCWTFMSEACVC